MGEERETVWRSLTERGVLSDERQSALRAEFEAEPPAGDGAAVLDWLVARGEVSDYQADVVAGRSDGPLELGPYLVEGPITTGRLIAMPARTRGAGRTPRSTGLRRQDRDRDHEAGEQPRQHDLDRRDARGRRDAEAGENVAHDLGVARPPGRCSGGHVG